MLGLLLLQVLASCLWLGHSEVVHLFAKCDNFFYGKTFPNEVLHPKRPAWICQHFNSTYHYATLYDKDRRIPVYSAYIYNPGPGDRFGSWFLEPQLIDQNYDMDMDTETNIKNRYQISSERIGQSQAINQDYGNLQGFDRGHLIPSVHQSGDDSKWATFTLTNVVPQDKNLNNGEWSIYETKKMPKKTNGCTTTYVITGAVPGNNKVPSGNVNIPSHIWSAACCLVNGQPTKAWGVIAVNNNNKVRYLSLGKLEEELTTLYGGRAVTLFNNACPRQ